MTIVINKTRKDVLTSRNNAQGEWTGLLPSGRTIWKVGGELFTGDTRHVSNSGGTKLTPITQEEKDYLASRGVNL